MKTKQNNCIQLTNDASCYSHDTLILILLIVLLHSFSLQESFSQPGSYPITVQSEKSRHLHFATSRCDWLISQLKPDWIKETKWTAYISRCFLACFQDPNVLYRGRSFTHSLTHQRGLLPYKRCSPSVLAKDTTIN